ncbi:MAG: tRNA (N(6)-L-threonylcarbamoyladenosine(37)-C(2))-methylthiotransferase MtaB [Spirochaetaceae bacterium]
MRAAFFTLGCKLNQSESEALASSFASRGFFIVPHTEAADIYIINTCTVTSMAEQKARRMIRKAAREHPGAVILVTGCYAQLEGEEASGLAENVVVLRQEEKDLLLDLPGLLDAGCTGGPEGGFFSAEDVKECIRGLRATAAAPEAGCFRYDADTYSFHSRAFLKIQDGCDRRCAYCRVPLARGSSVSLDAQTVLDRALQIEESGYREIVLTGVNITSYRDISGERRAGENAVPAAAGLPELIELLTKRLSRARLRLSSLEPEMVTDTLVRAVAHRSVCPHFHIPVQSGSDRVLAAVGRPYRAERVQRAVEMLRSAKDDPFIAADVIVGLPGEEDADFEATRSVLEGCDFSRLHVFPYSPRPGTRLYSHPGPFVPQRVAGERAKILQKLSDSLYESYLQRWRGRELTAALEMQLEEGVWTGLTENYLHLEVKGVPSAPAVRGSLCSVRLEKEEGAPAGRFLGFL